MKSKNLLETLSLANLVIPNTLLKYHEKLKINSDEMILLAYFMSYNNEIAFDVSLISRSIGFETVLIMNMIGHLCELNLIDMKVKKTSSNVMKEYIDISLLYDKLLSFIMEDNIEKTLSEESNIYSEIEKEFGRTLSPIEFETIKGWLDANIDEELIHEALKEAILNGVTNLKYIDKIIFEWTKKGYKKKEDIKRKKDTSEEVIDIFDYDWLKDDE